MLFNSIPFLFFIVLFFGVWLKLKQYQKLRWIWICVMSFLFYGWWDWRFLFLLIGTGSMDYWCGKGILATRHKKAFLYLSVITNLASLLIFKYSALIAGSIDQLLITFGISSHLQQSIPEFTLVLPVGISFYTFNSLSYTIDLYRGKSKSADSWLHFMAFISFFPHLVAGPIIRARDILTQLKQTPVVDQLSLYHGVKTIIYGFFQKMVLADNLAVFVNAGFNDVQHTTGTLQWWICMLAFTFQIYFDFNGYSSIARGIAKICGIHFRLNFNQPYRAASFSDFWRRWHISLSSFFRDYVYIPLGGNRQGRFRAVVNQWLTMLLSGLWHGASWVFVLWGAVHAAFLTIETWCFKLLPQLKGTVIWRFLVFVSVVLAWVLFRAGSVKDAQFIYGQMLSWQNGAALSAILKSNVTVWLILAMAVEWSGKKYIRKPLNQWPVLDALVLAILLALIIFFRGPEQQFIYFQF
jgi:D-alanyl-lipoteichoic acid acyltransferase DltB (MBOAT superfamily)